MKNTFFTKLTALTRPDGSQIELCKTLNDDGTVKQYDLAATYSAKHIDIDDIDHLESLLLILSKQRSTCIVQGKLFNEDGGLIARNRSTLEDSPNCLLILDFDHTGINVDYKDRNSVIDGIVKLVDLLPDTIKNASTVFKISSTAGFNGKTELKGHLYVINRTPYRRAQFKAWVMDNDINADLAVIHPVQPVYTSDPIFQSGQDHVHERIYPVIGYGDADIVITDDVDVKETSGDVVLADPKQKPGIIGAFCRAFPLRYCIEQHLSHVFTPSQNRRDHYNFLLGGGSVEGCFITSHAYLVNSHSSDPCKNRSSHSWDLCQAHLFGGSFDQMKVWAETITEVMVELKGAAARYGSSKPEVIEQEPEQKKTDVAVVEQPPTVDVPVTEELMYSGIPNSQIPWEILTAKEELALMGDPEFAQLVPVLKSRITSTAKLSFLVKQSVTPSDVDTAKGLINSNMDLKMGIPTKTIQNATLILGLDPYIKNIIAYNEMSTCVVVLGDLPWRKVDAYAASQGNAIWSDSDDSGLMLHIHRMWGVDLSADTVRRAVNAYAELNKAFHPIKSYLKSVKWDGVKRLETITIRTMGVDDNVYTRTITKKFFVGGVARALNPGCEWHFMPVFLGRQGLGKTTFVKEICPFPSAFGGNPPPLCSNKESKEWLVGKWIIEVGELSSLNGRESSEVKNFVTTNVDTFRAAYAARTAIYPRSCIFIGNANNYDFLRDDTGNRRFWPIVVNSQLDVQTLRLERDQLWAEAVELYLAGEELYLDDKEVERIAQNMQREHMHDDGITGIIEAYLDRPTPKWWLEEDFDKLQDLKRDEDWDRPEACVKRMAVSAQEIAVEVLGKQPGAVDVMTAKAIGRAMSSIGGWSQTADRKINRGRYGKTRCYTRDGYESTVHTL